MTVGLRGLGDIRERSDATLWMCAFLPSTTEMCRIPTPAEIAADTSTYGGHLSAESKAAATAEAQEVIAADMVAHPEAYSALNPAPLSDWTTMALVIGGIGLLAWVSLKKARIL